MLATLTIYAQAGLFTLGCWAIFLYIARTWGEDWSE